MSIFSGSSVIAEYDNGAAPASPSREYIYNPPGGSTTGLLAMISGGATTYYHQDALSVRLTTDGSGSILTQDGTFPFGESWYQSGTTNKWIFTSYQRDSESGLDYALARYYDSRTGTFCSADPLAGDPSDPQSWNRYPYGRNDPITITDPSGQSWTSFFEHLGEDLLNALPGRSLALWIGDSIANGEVSGPPPMGFGSFGGGVSLGSSWNGTPIMPSGGLTNGIQTALGLPTMADVGGPINNFDAKKVYCNMIPSGRSESLSLAFGGIGFVSGSVDEVHNYNSGQTSLFATGGGGLGWNGGVSATATTGLVYGLDKTNNGFSGPFKGGQFYVSTPVPFVSAGGSVVHGGGVTVASGGVGASPVGRVSFGGTSTKTTKPLNVGKFTGFRFVDYLGYLARRPCN